MFVGGARLKKTSLLLIILFLASFLSAISLNQSELHVITVVDQLYSVKIIAGGVAVPTTRESFDQISAVGTGPSNAITFSSEDVNLENRKLLQAIAYCNIGPSRTVEVTAAPMSASGSSTKIGYQVRVLDSPNRIINVLYDDTSVTFDIMSFNISDFTIANKSFDIQLNKEDYEAASAGDYKTEWTIDLKSP